MTSLTISKWWDRGEGKSVKIPGAATQGRAWSLDDVPYAQIDRSHLRDSAVLFYLVTSASFIEITTALYTRNLVEHFKGNAAAQAWLSEHWLPEEVQHGQALKRYVQEAWPEFDWERAFRHFYDAYSAVCTSESLEPDQGMEMVSRCVVEVGTSTYYTALGNWAGEPVLRKLCGYIARDEVRHYTYFHTYFRQYSKQADYGRWRVLRAILRRLAIIENEDLPIAAASVQLGLPEGHDFRGMDYQRLLPQAARALRPFYPYRTAAQMLLRPLALRQSVSRALTPVLTGTARLVMLRRTMGDKGSSRAA